MSTRHGGRRIDGATVAAAQLRTAAADENLEGGDNDAQLNRRRHRQQQHEQQKNPAQLGGAGAHAYASPHRACLGTRVVAQSADARSPPTNARRSQRRRGE